MAFKLSKFKKNKEITQMKLKNQQLKQIIREELQNTLREMEWELGEPDPPETQEIKKILQQIAQGGGYGGKITKQLQSLVNSVAQSYMKRNSGGERKPIADKVIIQNAHTLNKVLANLEKGVSKGAADSWRADGDKYSEGARSFLYFAAEVAEEVEKIVAALNQRANKPDTSSGWW